MTRTPGSLEPLFRPRSIAIVGASADTTRSGSRPLRLFDSLGTPGTVYPVNPSHSELGGHRCYGSVAEIPETVDLAIVQVARQLAVDAVRECAAAGVRAVCMLTAGFGEFDEEGAVLEAQLRDICDASGMRLLGPNCLGIVNFNLPFVAAQTDMFEAVGHRAGGVGIVAQSGAFGGALWVQGLHRGIGFSSFVSTGNEIDIDAADVLDFYATDPDTSIVACYLEAVHDGPRLVEALKKCRDHGKPVVVLKVGVSELGARAAASHTGAAAGSDEVFAAALRDTGARRVAGPAEMIDVLYAFQQSKTRDPIDGVVTLTPSGGFGVYVSDLAGEAGLPMPTPSPELVDRILQIQPNATTLNPIDMTGLPPKGRTPPYFIFSEISEVLCDDPQFDTILLITYVTPHLPRWVRALETAIRLAAETSKRIVVIGITDPEVRRRLEEAGAMVFAEPRHAIAALAELDAVLRESSRTGRAPVPVPAPADVVAVAGDLRRFAAEGRTSLSEREGKDVLRKLGIGTVAEELVDDAASAASAAARLGFPVVVKGTSRGITHKSELGLVELGIESPEEASAVFDRMVERLDAAGAAPDDREILVQQQVRPGTECIVGIENDPTFGPVVMFGAGGVFTEVMGDHVFALCPLTTDEARDLVGRPRIAAVLDGARGRAPGDRQALVEAVSRLACLAYEARDVVTTVEINPLGVQDEGEGVVALDIVLALRYPAEQLV